ncbi:MAG: hypothetical protein AB7D29_07695 [Campylobacterales bacterium]
MRYFQTESDIRAIEEGQEHLIRSKWVELSEAELVEMLKPTPEQEAAIAEAKAKAERIAAMLNGGVYTLGNTDYRVSFTKDDGDGLMQVKSAFELGLTSTTIHFENGTKMPISAAEFGAFAAWFVAKRNEFFV